MFREVLERKEAFLDCKIIGSKKKNQNLPFSKGVSPWFLSKNGHFVNLLFLCKIDQEKVFSKFLEKNETFLDNKKKCWKQAQICIFPWFLSKNGDFFIFCFYAKWSRKKSFEKFLKEKKFSKTIKTGLKTSKNCIFQKSLVHGFCIKMEIFLSFVFMQNGSRWSVFWSFEKKRNLFGL